MSNKTFVLGLILTAVFWAYSSSVLAADIDKGPKEMVLLAVKDKAAVEKPAKFPHAAHQTLYKCGTCHHTKKDGKQSPYVEGMTIQKCEDCHYKGSGMPSENDSEKGIVKLDKFKDAAHARCKTCHNKEKSKHPELKKKWKGCRPCHG